MDILYNFWYYEVKNCDKSATLNDSKIQNHLAVFELQSTICLVDIKVRNRIIGENQGISEYIYK